MGGLIPLLLPSGGGSRIVPSDGYESRRRASVQEHSSPLPPAHRRQQSLPVVTLRSHRRPSISTSVQQITVLPYTADEWKKTLSEVKQKYLNRKYRTCSARCCDILDNLKDTSSIEPLHLVYLHFYAASSFEMCARPLSQSSSYRTKLLRDAREHYEDAALLLEKAEEVTTQKSRSGSVCSTASQSPFLPSCLNASSLSPRSSLSSGDEAPGKRTKKKKKVSFSGLPDLEEVCKPSLQPEPYLRPDSPTLGWEESYYLFGAPEPEQQQQQPAAPASPPLASVAETEPEPKSPAPSPREEMTFPERTSTPAPPADDDGRTFDLELFLQTRSMNRLVSQLSALRSQISYHRDAIEGLLVTSEEAAEIPSVPEVPPVPSIPGLTRNVSPFSNSSSSAEDSDGPPTPTSTTAAVFEQHADFSPKTRASPGFFDLEAHMRRMEEQQQQQQLMQRQQTTYFTMPDWNKGSTSPTAAIHHGRSQSNVGPYYIPSRPTSSDSNSSEATMTPSINARQMGHQIQRPASVAAIARPASTAPSFSSTSTASDEALRDRIERLRAGGWQRKRFDSRRYEALREQVLGELGA
ncbi:hypothetical protein PG999_013760 [Apiospora kogelbergensis]|uniref:Uncharacterized protein n=1 Tax=Apiospora kogelbergensis TaxID=1337665 RepID=A0AAW0Q694_9PEZI